MNRVATWLTSVISLVAMALAMSCYVQLERRPSGELEILQTIQRSVADATEQRASLQKLGLPESGFGELAAYLSSIRKDGLPKHAEERIGIDALNRDQMAIVALLDAYAPLAHNEDFKRQAGNYRAYALAFNDHWVSVMEYFMAGGSYPAGELRLPEGFEQALQAEEKKAR